jgi:hypothetical protein
MAMSVEDRFRQTVRAIMLLGRKLIMADNLQKESGFFLEASEPSRKFEYVSEWLVEACGMAGAAIGHWKSQLRVWC